MATEEPSDSKTIRWPSPIAVLGWWIAILALLLLYIRSAYPDPSPEEFQTIRVVLALAAAGAAIVLPGFLHFGSVNLRISLVFGAALALFALAYFETPARLVAQSPKEVVVTLTACLGEYESNCGFPHDVYLYCYSDVEAWARQKCNKPTATAIGSHDGNKCGYTNVKVLCPMRAP